MAECLRVGPERDAVWYVAEPETTDPPMTIWDDRFVESWPGAWQRVQHGRCWLSVSQEADVIRLDFDGPAFMSVTYTVTFHNAPPREILDRIRDSQMFALGVDSASRMARVLFARIGGSPTIKYRAGDETVLTVRAHDPDSGPGGAAVRLFTVSEAAAAMHLSDPSGAFVSGPAV